MQRTKAAIRSGDNGPLYSVRSFRAEESVGLLVGLVRSQLLAALDDGLADLDLTGAQLPVLHWISQTPECTAAALCRRTGMDTGSMTRMLDRLEEKNFIRRVPSSSDRRAVYLELTATGLALRPKLTPRIVKVLNRNLAGFSHADLQTLKDLLRRILANA